MTNGQCPNAPTTNTPFTNAPTTTTPFTNAPMHQCTNAPMHQVRREAEVLQEEQKLLLDAAKFKAAAEAEAVVRREAEDEERAERGRREEEERGERQAEEQAQSEQRLREIEEETQELARRRESPAKPTVPPRLSALLSTKRASVPGYEGAAQHAKEQGQGVARWQGAGSKVTMASRAVNAFAKK